MRTIVLAIVLLFCSLPLLSQYYLRGEVRDQQGNLLPHVKINISSKGDYLFYTGSTGSFGIPTALKIDTITIIADGYETVKAAVNTSAFASFSLKLASAIANSSSLRLSSLTENLITYQPYKSDATGESYSKTVENEFVIAKHYPETDFSINVDRASYSNIRRFLNIKAKVPKEAVRIEEMLNYFNFRSQEQMPANETFSVVTKVTSCPWKTGNQLLFVNVRANKISLDNTPPSNLVFLIDVSGSMAMPVPGENMPDRLQLLKNGFKLMVENLRSIDTVSIITYGSGVSVQLVPTGGDKKQKIIEAIEGLSPAGSTPGESAIRTAYMYANNTFIKGGNNRIILATDGDFNVGQTTEKELEELITKQRQTGIYLTCLGVGMGNYKDSKLEALAKRGNGNFAYLDCDKEAEKVLVEEFAQTVYTVANDVHLTVRFNPAIVKEYRLVGFDNPQNAVADTAAKLEGGEVGSGHALMALFEIIPVDANSSSDNKGENIASLKLRYKLPGNKTAEEKRNYDAASLCTDLNDADSSLRFACAVAMFGSLLKDSKFTKEVVWDDISAIALSSSKADNLLQKEFAALVEKAKKIYPKSMRK